jgi:hypothetical protein
LSAADLFIIKVKAVENLRDLHGFFIFSTMQGRDKKITAFAILRRPKLQKRSALKLAGRIIPGA